MQLTGFYPCIVAKIGDFKKLKKETALLCVKILSLLRKEEGLTATEIITVLVASLVGAICAAAKSKNAAIEIFDSAVVSAYKTMDAIPAEYFKRGEDDI